MNYVVGIDPSLSATGVCVLSGWGELSHMGVVSSPPSGGRVHARMDRIEKMVRDVKRIVDEYKPVLICIEGYSLGSNMPGVSDRVEYGGLLRYVLTREFKLIEVNPLSLKKWATGKGAGDKTALIAAITAKYQVQFKSSDEYDAYALARMAMQIAGCEQPGNQIQKDCIDVAVNGKPAKPKRSKVAK